MKYVVMLVLFDYIIRRRGYRLIDALHVLRIGQEAVVDAVDDLLYLHQGIGVLRERGIYRGDVRALHHVMSLPCSMISRHTHPDTPRKTVTTMPNTHLILKAAGLFSVYR